MAAHYTAGCSFDQLYLARNGYNPSCCHIVSTMSRCAERQDNSDLTKLPWTITRSLTKYSVLLGLQPSSAESCLLCMPYTGSQLVYTEVCIYHAVYKWSSTLRTKVFLSPIAQFPGLKLAAFNTSYYAYFDVVQNSQLFKYLNKLHDKYGKDSRMVYLVQLFLDLRKVMQTDSLRINKKDTTERHHQVQVMK